MILVANIMISGMGNLMVRTTTHFRWRPSWIFKMAVQIPILPYYCSSMPQRDMVIIIIIIIIIGLTSFF